jgi:hypothetical protein
MLRLASTELGSFFFQPFQFHLEPANLLLEFALDRFLLLVVLTAVASEHIHPIFQQLPFPLANLVSTRRVPEAVFARQFADRLLAFGRFQRYPKLEVGTESSTLLGHLPDPPRTDRNCGFPL